GWRSLFDSVPRKRWLLGKTARRRPGYLAENHRRQECDAATKSEVARHRRSALAAVGQADLSAAPARRNASNSARVGNAVCVPRRVTVSAATAAAFRAASRNAIPPAQKTARLPVNTSPAPVGSTAVTGIAGIWVTPASSRSSTPRSPSVTATAFAPRVRK